MISGPLKWHGGKSYLAAWLHSLAPAKETYTTRVICFAGGLGEFWNWDHDGTAEVVNDINRALTNFWRVLQDPASFATFLRTVQNVPFSQEEWKNANWPEWVNESALTFIPVKEMPDARAAAAFFIRIRQSRQGLGKAFATMTKRRIRGGMNEQASAWLTAVDGLAAVHGRLNRIVIFNEDVLKLIDILDDPLTFFYLDPPYLDETRTAKACYEYELTWDQHDELLFKLSKIKGKFMLSGYPSKLYGDWALAKDWKCHQRLIDNKSSGKNNKEMKMECVWSNY